MPEHIFMSNTALLSSILLIIVVSVSVTVRYVHVQRHVNTVDVLEAT